MKKLKLKIEDCVENFVVNELVYALSNADICPEDIGLSESCGNAQYRCCTCWKNSIEESLKDEN